VATWGEPFSIQAVFFMCKQVVLVVVEKIGLVDPS
jgi:hypothetical protein